LNAATRALFSDINRCLGDIVAASGAPVAIEHDEPATLRGLYRVVRLRKISA